MNFENLQNFIHNKTDEMIRTGPIIRKANDGTLKKCEMGEYLFNLVRILEATPPNLARAAERSSGMGFPILCRFFEDKLSEEQGHDEWAKTDLSYYGDAGVSGYRVHPETVGIVEFTRNLIERDPRLYVAYVTYVECLTVKAAGSFLQDLKEKCEIPSFQATAIANHEEKDRYHTRENFDFLEKMTSEKLLGAEHDSEILSVIETTHNSILAVMNACTSH